MKEEARTGVDTREPTAPPVLRLHVLSASPWRLDPLILILIDHTGLLFIHSM